MPLKPVVPLTPEQQALASQWVRLARKISAKRGQDLGVCLEALCRAARGFDASRGWTFQAWATRILENACTDELRKKKHVELCPFDEGLHAAAAGHADILGERDALPEPVRPWTPPPDPVVRPPRPPGTSKRTLQRRAKQEGSASPPGRPAVLSDKVLAAVLCSRPGLTSAQLADVLGVSARTIRRADEKRHDLRRLRRGEASRIFGNGTHLRPPPDRAPPAGHAPGAPAPPRWQ